LRRFTDGQHWTKLSTGLDARTLLCGSFIDANKNAQPGLVPVQDWTAELNSDFLNVL
jgi:hypothetical protein